MKILLTLLLVAIGIFGLFAISKFTERYKSKGMLLWQFSYQFLTLIMALSLLLINRVMHTDYRSAFNRGILEAPTEHFGWLGNPLCSGCPDYYDAFSCGRRTSS